MSFHPLLAIASLFLLVTEGSTECSKNNGSICFLDVAMDMIKKAKECTPKCEEDKSTNKAVDCEELLLSGFNKSGVYTIWPRSRVNCDKPLRVYCDMQLDGGGWTVIQRRGDFKRPIDYFYKGWSSYKEGFGDIEKEFWLGNDNIFSLTNQKLYSARFDMKAVNGTESYALYDSFWIGDESQKYVLNVADYSGTAGDSLTYHNGMKFTTKDSDNDESKTGNCAQHFQAAWWFKVCRRCCLNGLNYRGKTKSPGEGVNWFTFTGDYESLDTSEIKIRSKSFKSNLISYN